MLNIAKSFVNKKFDVGENFRFCFDRAMQKEDKNASEAAASTASGLQGNAQGLGAQLTPFYRSEMNAQHAFNPQQMNELLGAGEAGIAGSNVTAMGQAQSQAARTRNTSGFSSALDENARERMRQTGALGQGVAASDVMGAKDLNQQGAAGMSGLYGTDTNAMLGAMGIRNNADQNATEAGKSGWLQNGMSMISTLFPKGLQGGNPFTGGGRG